MAFSLVSVCVQIPLFLLGHQPVGRAHPNLVRPHLTLVTSKTLFLSRLHSQVPEVRTSTYLFRGCSSLHNTSFAGFLGAEVLKHLIPSTLLKDVMLCHVGQCHFSEANEMPDPWMWDCTFGQGGTGVGTGPLVMLYSVPSRSSCSHRILCCQNSSFYAAL